MTGNFYGMLYEEEEHEFATKQQAFDDIDEMKKDGWDAIYIGESLFPNALPWVVTYRRLGSRR